MQRRLILWFKDLEWESGNLLISSSGPGLVHDFEQVV